MGKTVLIALGGNALIKSGQKGTAKQQLANLDNVSEKIVKLYNLGHKIVITHGNGPQVGNILLQQEKAKDYASQMPLYVCVAQSQGMIGYFLQESLYNKLHRKGFKIPVVTIVTQVLVNKKDKAFKKPTKPIGPYYPNRIRMDRKWKITRTIKGFRRVVASPTPRDIIEGEEIRKISKSAIVIASGGGGIPVYKERGLKGVDAVIDKDLAAVKLAEAVKAHSLVILTDVENVYLNYKKTKQKKLTKVTLAEIRKYYSQGHFHSGSMGPKVLAAMRFIQKGGKRVIITSLDKLEQGINEECGTIIKKGKKVRK